MSDYIATLPVDDEPLPPDERYMAEQIFSRNPPTPSAALGTLLAELRGPVITGALFAVFSMSFVTNTIRDIIPYTKSSELSLILFKTVVFVILIYVMNNLHLLRR